MRVVPALLLTAVISAGVISAGALPSPGGNVGNSIPSPAAPAPVAQPVDSVTLHEEARAALRDRLVRNRSHRATMERLDRVAEGIPGDDWVLRQRIAQRLLLQRFQEVDQIIEACAPERWWCHALALYRGTLVGDWDGAHRAAVQLEAHQPPSVACAWLDEAWHLLEGEAARGWTGLDCRGREELVERLWWLSDPAHMEEANPRKLEHLGRVVGMVLHHDELDVLGNVCPMDHHRPVLREGWEDTGYWVVPSDPLLPRRSAPNRSWLPTREVLDDPFGARSRDWRWDARPRAGGPGARLEGVTPTAALESHQVAVLPRGDSMEVHAAFRIPDPADDRRFPDSLPEGRAGMVLSAGPGERVVVRAPWPDPSTREVRLSGALEASPRLLSLEALPGRTEVAEDGTAWTEGGIFRERFGLPVPPEDGGLQLSDLVLFHWDPELPEEARAVVPRMQSSLHLDPGGRPTGIHWEVHGLAPGEEVRMTLVMEEVDAGRLRRLGRALRLVGPGSALEVSWTDWGPEPSGAETTGGPRPPSFLARSLRPSVPELREGMHLLELRVQTGDGRSARARRTVQVSGSPGAGPG
ncbi:MAG: hypothetical protein EA352_03930 [Gemmatimonadales bacterium]|nr:MAG: hypothetical protein EA352_03930 [Gemmatimonadales bacterium]